MLRERERREERERRDQEEQERAEASRTPDQVLGDSVAEAFRPGAKEARNAAFLRSLGLLGEGGDEQ